MAATRKVSPPDEAHRRLELAGASAGWASTTEELHESTLVVLVGREHGREIAGHDLERRHRWVALRRRHVREDREIALLDRLALRLLRQLPGHEGFGGLDIAAGLEDGDRLADRRHAFLRKDEVDRRSLRLGVERHVLDDDAVGLFAARHRLDDRTVAPAGYGAVAGESLEIAPTKRVLLHHRADMDDGGAGIERMREDGLAGGRRRQKLIPRAGCAFDQARVDDDSGGDQLGSEKGPIRIDQ